MSQRERLIAIVALSAAGLLGLDRFALSPLMERREKAELRAAQAQADLDEAEGKIAASRRASAQWAAMGGTSLKRDASEAESQVLHSVQDWAQEAGLALSAIKPERAEKDRGYQKITLQATGAGSMDQVGRFLYRIQTASIPVHLTEFQLASRKENTDDLTIQFKVATIYLLPTGEKKEGKP